VTHHSPFPFEQAVFPDVKPGAELPPALVQEPPMKFLRSLRLPTPALLALAGVGLLVLGAIVGAEVVPPMLERLHGHGGPAEAEKKDAEPTHELVRDATGKPVTPPAIRLSAEAMRSLKLTQRGAIRPARAATEPRPLAPLEGQLQYDLNRLYPVRPRFPGEVVEVGQTQDTTGAVTPTRFRPLDLGDSVEGPRFDKDGKLQRPGQLLAVIWSQALGDKKAALIDALIDLRRDEKRLKDLEGPFREGILPFNSYYEAQRTVQKDINAAKSAERALRMWKLSDGDIREIKDEAAKIQEDRRDPKTEKDWARVEVRAPHDGIIIEKNTNLGDWVDTTNGPPIYKVGDLRRLAVWINAPEELRPTLQRLLKQSRDDGGPGLSWQIRLNAEPNSAPLTGPVVQIAPSLDPTQRTLLVIGRVDNPGAHLLVGQMVTATIMAVPGKDLVEIPTTAVNEQDGQSLVFVQAEADGRVFQLRRVAVAERFRDVILVRSKLTARDRSESRKGRQNLLEPIRPLSAGERVLTRGVPMLTEALRDLLAKEGGEDK
jgi:cobalt-zinc-cadmium efflux system membrane fusion protein